MAEISKIREDVREWIEWIRSNLDVAEEIPAVTDISVSGLWNMEVQDLFGRGWQSSFRSDLLAVFEDELAKDPADIPARFTAVHLYSSLSRVSIDEVRDEFLMPKDSAEDSQIGYEQDLGYIIRLLAVEQCPAEWRIVRWEILNSYLVRDWKRALAFYKKAHEERLLADAESQLLVGQFKFLLVFAREIQREVSTIPNMKLTCDLESLTWKPQIFSVDKQDDEVFSVLLLIGSLSDKNPKLALTQLERENLLEATLDLQRALSGIPNISPVYRAMLAKCYFATDHFHDAAKEYEVVVNSDVGSLTGGMLGRLHKSLALSYLRAGSLGDSERALRQWIKRFPGNSGPYLMLAEVQSKQTKFEDLVETIREASERTPELDADWKLSSLLALGETRNKSNAFLTELKSHFDFSSIGSLLREYWEPFKKMCPEAQEKWIAGSFLNHWCGQRAPKELIAREAAVFFATAVELELVARYFSEFRSFVQGTPDLVHLAEEMLQSEDIGTFCQFLVRKRPLTLGHMVNALQASGKSNSAVMNIFRQWLDERRFPREALPRLESVSPIRNKALHVGRTSSDIGMAATICKALLELLVCSQNRL
jgi:tetratricopeptide (TPR) repeat protein